MWGTWCSEKWFLPHLQAQSPLQRQLWSPARDSFNLGMTSPLWSQPWVLTGVCLGWGHVDTDIYRPEWETLAHRIKLPEVALGISTARLHSQPLSWLCHAWRATGTSVPRFCQPTGHLVPHCQDSDPMTSPPEVHPEVSSRTMSQSASQHSPEINLQGFIIGEKKMAHVLMKPEKFPAPKTELTGYTPREPVFQV